MYTNGSQKLLSLDVLDWRKTFQHRVPQRNATFRKDISASKKRCVKKYVPYRSVSAATAPHVPRVLCGCDVIVIYDVISLNKRNDFICSTNANSVKSDSLLWQWSPMSWVRSCNFPIALRMLEIFVLPPHFLKVFSSKCSSFGRKFLNKKMNMILWQFPDNPKFRPLPFIGVGTGRGDVVLTWTGC